MIFLLLGGMPGGDSANEGAGNMFMNLFGGSQGMLGFPGCPIHC